MEYITTLKALREAHACVRGYNLIAAHVGYDFEGDIPLETILEVNGVDDCIWAFRALPGDAGGYEARHAFWRWEDGEYAMSRALTEETRKQFLLQFFTFKRGE